MRSLPSEIRKPIEAPSDTRNSPVSTEPTTLRGSIRPELSSAGVLIGPHPPPPARAAIPDDDRGRATQRPDDGLAPGRLDAANARDPDGVEHRHRARVARERER
jgi:hypothetical protein